MTTRINNPYAAVSPRSLSPSLATAASVAYAANSLGVSTHSVDTAATATAASGGSFYGATHCAASAANNNSCGDHYTRQASFTTTCSSAAGCSCYQAGVATAVAVAGSPSNSSFHPAYAGQHAAAQQGYHHHAPHYAYAPNAAATAAATTAVMQCEHCSTAASTPRSANTPSSSTSSSASAGMRSFGTPAVAAPHHMLEYADQHSGDVAADAEAEQDGVVAYDGEDAAAAAGAEEEEGMFSRHAAAAQTTEFGYGYQPQPQHDAAAMYHDAYATSVLPEPLVDASAVTTDGAVTTMIPATLHAHALSGIVPFVPYDRDARLANMSTPPRCAVPREALCRLFIGQLPYTLSDSELAWCFYVLTNGQATIFYIERIVHWRNGRQPSGCVHAYCYPRDRDAILALNQRVLFDECGLWVATPTPAGAPMMEDRRALAQYCSFLAVDKAHRAAQRPYQCMCVQVATSTYLPHLERQRRMHAARAAQASRPAVFSGGHAAFGGGVSTQLFGAAAVAAPMASGAVPMYGGMRTAVPAPSAYAQLAPHAW